MKTANSTVGARIKRRRIALGLTQHQLAADVGVSVQAISQWEGDKTKPDSSRLSKLVDSLKTDMGHLLLGHMPLEEPWRRTNVRAPLLGAYQILNVARHELPAVPEETLWYDVTTVVGGIAFATTIPSRSNYPLFSPGDIVIFDTYAPHSKLGDMVIAREGEEGVDYTSIDPVDVDMENLPIGRLRSRALESGEVVTDIVPLNPDYPTVTFSEERPGVIIGIMIEHRRLRTKDRPLSGT